MTWMDALWTAPGKSPHSCLRRLWSVGGLTPESSSHQASYPRPSQRTASFSAKLLLFALFGAAQSSQRRSKPSSSNAPTISSVSTLGVIVKLVTEVAASSGVGPQESGQGKCSGLQRGSLCSLLYRTESRHGVLGGFYATGRTTCWLVSCNRSSQHNSAPTERHNLDHGVSRGLRHPPSPPSPLPLGQERGAEGGARAIEPRARALG